MSTLFLLLVNTAPHHRLSFAEWTRLRDERHARNAAKALANLTLLHSALRPDAASSFPAPAPVPVPDAAPAAPMKLATAEAPSTNRAAYTMIGVGSLALLALLLTRKKKTRPASLFTVVGNHRLGAKHSLQVIDVGGQRLLMSVGDKGVELLCSLEQRSAADLAHPMQTHAPMSEETSGIVRLKDRVRGATAGGTRPVASVTFATELSSAAERLAALRGVA